MRIIKNETLELVSSLREYILFNEDNISEIKEHLKNLFIILGIENNIEIIFNELSIIKEKINIDIDEVLINDPASKSRLEVKLAYPGIYAILVYRFANVLYKLEIPIIPRLLSELAHSKTGIDIHPGATIGCPFYIDHGTGIVIGETTIIGNYVKIYHGVTLGAKNVDGDNKKKRHPTIGNNVTIYANATILGEDTIIGDNVIIGCNLLCTKSVKNNSIIYRDI